MISMLPRMTQIPAVPVLRGLALAGALALAGCAGSSTGGDPGARPLPAGQTCQSVRGELNKMDSQGARSAVEAVSAGRKVSSQQQAISDRYNQLLNDYLGARCHV